MNLLKLCRQPRLALLATALALAGCASPPPGAQPDPRDPLEGYNRSMYQFNQAVDRAVMTPAAKTYTNIVPQPARTGVSNFFANLGDVWSFVNNVLQAKPEPALSSMWRVLINTTVGLGGVLDPATEMRLTRYREDFGQTLGYWGVPAGPYLVLPLLGPSSLRDTAALPVDWYGHPISFVDNVRLRNVLTPMRFVDTRASLLGVTNLMQQAALDPYAFERDAFLQKRRNDVYDGDPPSSAERYDLDEPETPAAQSSANTPPTEEQK